MLQARIGNTNILDADSLFEELIYKLDKRIPFTAGKIGGFELWALRVKEFGYHSQRNDAYYRLCNNAGFFVEENKSIDEGLSLFILFYRSQIFVDQYAVLHL